MFYYFLTKVKHGHLKAMFDALVYVSVREFSEVSQVYKLRTKMKYLLI